MGNISSVDGNSGIHLVSSHHNEIIQLQIENLNFVPIINSNILQVEEEEYEDDSDDDDDDDYKNNSNRNTNNNHNNHNHNTNHNNNSNETKNYDNGYNNNYNTNQMNTCMKLNKKRLRKNNMANSMQIQPPKKKIKINNNTYKMDEKTHNILLKTYEKYLIYKNQMENKKKKKKKQIKNKIDSIKEDNDYVFYVIEIGTHKNDKNEKQMDDIKKDCQIQSQPQNTQIISNAKKGINNGKKSNVNKEENGHVSLMTSNSAACFPHSYQCSHDSTFIFCEKCGNCIFLKH